jgi:mannosyltransferase OCH1-like enzyme
MIPKKIHYVWLGKGEKSDKIKRCIESWKKYLPDYEIIEWNEDNFDINYNDFTKKSYELKKYAFTSDVVRLYALYTQGGIYMDTDVEVYKPLDEFLNEEGFTGFEDIHYPVTATMGCVKGNPVIKMMLDYYDCVDFKMYDDWKDFITNEETSTCIYSNVLGMLGIDRERNEEQHIKHFTVYPRSYFFTKDEGYTYHSFTGSW